MTTGSASPSLEAMKVSIQSWLQGLVAVAMLTGAGYPCCLAESANSPKLFAPGVVSGPADDLSPAFTPDGKTVYFARGNGAGASILESKLAQDRWSVPKLAAFSERWSDSEPTMSPDGT